MLSFTHFAEALMAGHHQYDYYSPESIHHLMLAFMADEGYGHEDATEIADCLQMVIDDYEGSYEHFFAEQGSEIARLYGETLAGFVLGAIWRKYAINV